MKYFRMSYREVVFERSYINILLLNRAIPGIKPIDEEEKENTSPLPKVKRTTAPNVHANTFFEQFM